MTQTTAPNNENPRFERKFSLTRVMLLSGITLLVLLVLALFGLSIMLGTSPGSAWVVNRISNMLDNEQSSLQIGNTEGTLLWGLSLSNVVYRSGDKRIEISQMNSRWNPLPLLARQFSIETVQITGLNVYWRSVESPPDTDATTSLNDLLTGWLPLPVDLQLDNVRLTGTQVNFNEQIYTLDELGFNATLTDTHLLIEELQLESLPVAQGLVDLQAELDIELSDNLTFSGDVVWQFNGPLYEDITQSSGTLQVNGNLNVLNLEHMLQTPAQLRSVGTVELASVTSASAAPAMRMDLTHTLLQTTLPLNAVTDMQFESLTLRTDGWLDTLAITGSTTVSSDLLAPINVRLDTQWRGTQLVINNIDLASGTGGLQGSGVLDWADGIALNFAYQLDESNPRVWYAALPEGLQLGPFTSSGTANLLLREEVLQGTFNIATLEGELNGYPTTGSGTVNIDGNEYSIDNFTLQSGQNNLAVSGTYAEEVDLQFVIDIPVFNTLYADASGSLLAQGIVAGTLTEPRITVDGRAQNLHLGNMHIAQMQIQGRYLDAINTVQLQVQDFSTGNTQDSIIISSARANLSGLPAEHQFDLALQSTYGNVELALSGQWLEGIWSGSLDSSRIESQAGIWALQETTTLLLSTERINVAAHCWLQSAEITGSVCMNAEWTPAQLLAQIELSDYPLDIFNSESGVALVMQHLSQDGSQTSDPVPVHHASLPYQLADNLAIHGVVNANVTLSGSLTNNPADLAITASVDLEEGRFFLVTDTVALDTSAAGDETGITTLERFSWSSANLQAERLDNNWQLTTALEFFQQNIEDTNISMRGSVSAQASLDAQQNLQSQINLAFDDLSFLEAFLPQLQNTQGSLNSQLQVSGTLQEPRYSGDLLLENAATNVPALGIELRNLKATVSSVDGDSIVLNGMLESGAGTLNFNSEVFDPLAATRSLTVTLRGNDFQLADIPELELTASPDLQLVANNEGIHVTGTLTLPLLNAVITTLPESAIDVSGDTVIVNQSADLPEVRNAALAERGILEDTPLTAEIRLQLGDDVRFSGFGLSAHVQGALDINQRATGSPLTYGELSIVSGNFETYGQVLTIEHGKLLFFGSYDNPGLDIRAVREAENVKVGVQMNGTLRNIRSQLFSTPTLPDGEIIAVLLTGRPFSEIGNQDGNALVGAITTLGINQGQSLTNQIRNQLGLDTLAIASTGDASDSSLMLGKYLTPRIFIRYAVGLFETQSILAIDYTISDRVKLEATSGQNQSLDITYTVER